MNNEILVNSAFTKNCFFQISLTNTNIDKFEE